MSDTSRSTMQPCARALLAALVAVAATGAIAGTDLHDPLMPPGWRESRSAAPANDFDRGAWQLESTLTSNGRRVAIINGHAVRAGDHVDGARVLAIEPHGVRLDYAGHRFTIKRPTTRVRRDGEAAQ